MRPYPLQSILSGSLAKAYAFSHWINNGFAELKSDCRVLMGDIALLLFPAILIVLLVKKLNKENQTTW
jgi:hypothetical protein